MGTPTGITWRVEEARGSIIGGTGAGILGRCKQQIPLQRPSMLHNWTPQGPALRSSKMTSLMLTLTPQTSTSSLLLPIPSFKVVSTYPGEKRINST